MQINNQFSQMQTDYMKQIWSKYESIPNSYHDKTVKSIKEKGHTQQDIVWCASEKVHGANFSLITNGVDVMAGSRNTILDDNSRFFEGWKDVRDAEKERAIKAFNALNKKYNDKIKVVIIYGELFGGLYSHTDKEYMAKNEKKCIQKGIYYSPSLHFYAFDIKTDLEMNDDKKNDEEKIDGRLSVKESIQIFEECGFLHAKILKQGTFDEMMEFDVDNLQSTIPKLLNLPPPQVDDNIVEGVVIRPLVSKSHCLLKIKSQKFWEITGHQGKKTNKKPARILDERSKKCRVHVAKAVDDRFCNFIERCVNEQRLEAVESKIGRLDEKNVKEITWLFVEDVFDELLKEKSKIMASLNVYICKRFINALIQNFIREHMQCEAPKKRMAIEVSIKNDEVKLSKSQRRRRNRRRKKKASLLN